MKTLTSRLTCWYACVVTATVALVFWAGYYYLSANLTKGVDFLNDAEYEEIHLRLDSVDGDALDKKIAAAILTHTEIDASFFYFQVNDEAGRVVFRSSNMKGYSLPDSVHGKHRISIQDEHLGHLRVGEYIHGGWSIYIASSLQNVDALFEDLLTTMGWILISVFVISLVVGIFLSRLVLNPISNIQSIARKISANNLSERIPLPESKDELSELSAFLNEMFDRLEAAFQQIRRFTADASHELRTPLSLIRLHGERLLQNPDLPVEERLSALSEQMAEVQHLNKLIDDLLLIARADAGTLQLEIKPVSIVNFLEDFSNDARTLCEESGVIFKQIGENTAENICMDPVWMRHVLLNLLSNALRVSDPGATICLGSYPKNRAYWAFFLEDEGPGVPDEMLESIFERFRRVPNHSDKPDQVGSGLGLAICRSIVTQHHGRIYASKPVGRKGLCVHVELPRRI